MQVNVHEAATNEEDVTAELPDPPFTVRSQEHLTELLHEGLNSPTQEFTDDTLEQMRQEIRRRLAAKPRKTNGERL